MTSLVHTEKEREGVRDGVLRSLSLKQAFSLEPVNRKRKCGGRKMDGSRFEREDSLGLAGGKKREVCGPASLDGDVS